MPQRRISLPADAWIDVADATAMDSILIQNKSATHVMMRVATSLPDAAERRGFHVPRLQTVGGSGLRFTGNPGWRLYFRGPGQIEIFDGT